MQPNAFMHVGQRKNSGDINIVQNFEETLLENGTKTLYEERISEFYQHFLAGKSHLVVKITVP